MPILDQSYQHWRGAPHHRPVALVLGRSQARLLLARRWVRGLLIVSGIFMLVWAAMIYVESHSSRLGPLASLSGVLQVDAQSFRTFFLRQRLVHLLLCLAVADVIALDRRHRALQIYLARPVRVRDYVLGKGLAIAVPMSLTTWIPAVFLVLLKCTLKGGIAWMGASPWLLASILGYAVVLVVPLTLLTLAVSSLSSSPRQASAMLFAVLAFSGAAAQVLNVLARSDAWQVLSINANLDQVASWLFAVEPPRALAVGWSLLALGGLAAGSVLVLRQRIRPLDVVGGRA